MKTRRFRSFAKINLGLEVMGKLPGGYHELKTLFATVSLHDIIGIAETRKGITVRCDHPAVPSDETNLAHRAAALMQRISGRRTGVVIDIRKRIAVGGGLGGGSSNAATVLRALDLMWNLGLGPIGLLEAARSLGADVPYFLQGGPALGLGRGDDIQPLDVRLSERVLLIPGEGGVSTAAVFKRFATLAGRSRSPLRIDPFLRSLDLNRGARTPRALSTLRNQLEPAALRESPGIAVMALRLRRVARATGATPMSMSGSGSSFFLLFDNIASEQAAWSALREAKIPAMRCRFLSKRAYEARFEIKAPARLLR